MAELDRVVVPDNLAVSGTSSGPEVKSSILSCSL